MKVFYLLFAALSLLSCNFIETYKTEIVQGNVLTKDSLDKLKLGMSKQEVSDLLGSPVLVDIFHNDHWEYVNYSSNKNYRLQLLFENDRLVDVIASNLEHLLTR